MKLDSDTCYTQIYGPHSSLNDAKIACDNMGDECNGIQKVECTGVEPKITKSTLKTLCRSKHRYNEDPDCQVLMYEKDRSEKGIVIFHWCCYI